MLFSSHEMLLFHAVAEKRASVAEQKVASLLIWGRSAHLQASREHETPIEARTLHILGMSKLVTELIRQLEMEIGRVLLENAVHELESIVTEVRVLPYL